MLFFISVTLYFVQKLQNESSGSKCLRKLFKNREKRPFWTLFPICSLIKSLHESRLPFWGEYSTPNILMLEN